MKSLINDVRFLLPRLLIDILEPIKKTETNFNKTKTSFNFNNNKQKTLLNNSNNLNDLNNNQELKKEEVIFISSEKLKAKIIKTKEGFF